MREYLLCGVVVLATSAGVASADPFSSGSHRPIGFGNPLMPMEGGGAVVAGDHLSLGLYAYASSSQSAFINSGGDVSVTKGHGMTPIGDNVNGTGGVLAAWDEFVGPATNTVQAIWESDDGSDLLPAGVMLGGIPANYLNWRVGGIDPVNFSPFVTDLELVTVTIFASSNGGQSFDVNDLTTLYSSNWDGTDLNHALGLAGQGTNMLIAEYEYSFTLVPAPGVGILMGGFGVLAMRRRR